MRILCASALALCFFACSGPAKKAPAGPPADDVPQEVTCCITASGDKDPEKREVVPAEKCPEEKRNPVDACNVGPGENEPSM